MLSSIVAFFAMLNPFALFLYLQPIKKELDMKKFVYVLFKASFISFIIYFLFSLAGNFIFENFFQIQFDSFRIFGGIVIFTFAYIFLIKGQDALIHMKEDLDDLAAEIALPFMVGAGTISLTVIAENNYGVWTTTIMLLSALTLNFLFIILLSYLRDLFEKKKLRIAFDKNMAILLRLNAFFVGAIGVNMVITGLQNLFF